MIFTSIAWMVWSFSVRVKVYRYHIVSG
jgi:hypothetical protein